MKPDRSYKLQPPVDLGPRVVIRVTRRADPKRLARVAEILLDIIDTANRLDSKTTPVKDDRP